MPIFLSALANPVLVFVDQGKGEGEGKLEEESSDGELDLS